MRAMVLDEPGGTLHLRDLPVPEPGPGEVLVRVQACGLGLTLVWTKKDRWAGGTQPAKLPLEGQERKEPVEVYARAGDKVLGPHGTKDNTLAIFTLADGTLWSMVISWALPITWPGPAGRSS